MSWIVGAGATSFGRRTGTTTLELMREAADLALDDAGLQRHEIDALLVGYSTTHPHLMLGTVFAEYYGLKLDYSASLQVGGATGAAMLHTAHALVESGVAKRVLCVGGENRLSGQDRNASIAALAQIGHPELEAPTGAIIPTYYGLLASRYLATTGATELDLAHLAVHARQNAETNPNAHLRSQITVEDVLASKPVAPPLKLLDCCPLSDGGAAMIISNDRTNHTAIRPLGWGQAHTHQHLTFAPDNAALGGRMAATRALQQSKIELGDIGLAYVYDSFTVTLALLLEAIGFAEPGLSGPMVRDGYFNRDGELPLNSHGGLLSFGHSGVSGGLAHAVEAYRQLSSQCGDRQVQYKSPIAFLHGDGGVLSSHVSCIFERVQ